MSLLRSPERNREDFRWKLVRPGTNTGWTPVLRNMRRAFPVVLALLAACAAAVASGDLEVTYIERTPKYFSYQDHVLYRISRSFADDWTPYNIDYAYALSGQSPATRRWPNPAETVTWTAHVRNRGDQPINGFTYAWTVDGAQVGVGNSAPPLAPGQFRTFSRNWSWDQAEHRIGFSVEAAGDQHPSNDALEDYTNALTLFTFIDDGYAAAFAANTPNYPNPATDSIVEWLQRHATRMNEMFVAAGSPLRIRYDRLDFVADGAGLPAYDRANYDGNFPTRFAAGDGDIRGSGYYDPGEDIDYGLLHEIGHQLGLIDIYRINVSPEQNLVNGQAYSALPCLMNGVSHFISPHTAGAMAAWHGKRRGYFGQYLYDLPETIRLRFLGRGGEPLDGAEITIYQKIYTAGVGERIPNLPKFVGSTGPDGVFTLPNVPVNASDFWNDLGPGTSQLRPNPFGYISNHGVSGVFLIRVHANGFTDYVWFDITEPNIAYWSGQTGDVTFDRATAIGEGVQRWPPNELSERNAASWSSWAQDGSIALFDDASRRQVGQASIRIDATGGFDNLWRYPADTLAQWDLSGVQNIRVRFYAVNPNIGFQSGSPWVRLGNYEAGYFEWRSTSDALNLALNQWREYVIPIGGNGAFPRTISGTPSLDAINYIELHADTWGAGFTLWMDGLRFEPQPLPPAGDVNCDGAVDNGDIDAFVLALLDASAYEAAHPTCDLRAADVNADGVVDNGDIDAFVALLLG